MSYIIFGLVCILLGYSYKEEQLKEMKIKVHNKFQEGFNSGVYYFESNKMFKKSNDCPTVVMSFAQNKSGENNVTRTKYSK